MARTLDSFNEVGWKADNGDYIRVEALVQAVISVIRQHSLGNYKATIILVVVATGETLATYDREFTTLESLMDILGIDDIDEVWEVLES